MTDQNSNHENRKRRLDPDLLKKDLRCDLKQYEMLKRCDAKKDVTEWNEWRKRNFSAAIFLEGADLTGFCLSGIDLSDYGGIASVPSVYLKKVSLLNAHLEGAKLHKAHLEGAILDFAHLDDAFLLEVHLEDTSLQCAELRNANVCNGHFDRANFVDSHLQGSEFDNAFLIGAKFQKAHISGDTSFCYCKIDRETDFREVGLDSVRIDPATKQLLEYNIRRKNWEEWYPKHPWLRWPVRWFWSFSDYGISTWHIICWFFGLAFVFAGIYYLCALVNPPGIINSLIEGKEGLVPAGLLPFRSIYFSIVTMTTLGFGDMHANSQSLLGHLLLTLQVLLGYVLLGALVTRFAVLFTAGGPAGKFADEKTLRQRLKEWWNKIRKNN